MGKASIASTKSAQPVRGAPALAHAAPRSAAQARRAARRAAAARDGVEAVRLVVLFRAPPPFVMVAGELWTAAPVRNVTVVGAIGNTPEVRRMQAVQRRHGWVAYANDRLMPVTGRLVPTEEGSLWAWGWNTRAARALRAAQALR